MGKMDRYLCVKSLFVYTKQAIFLHVITARNVSRYNSKAGKF